MILGNLMPYDQRRIKEGAAASWQCIDKEATSKNTEPKTVANTCSSAVRLGINIPNTTPSGKRREIGLLKWTHVMKYMPKKKRARKSWTN